MTSAFKTGSGSCCGRPASPSFPGGSGFAGVFPAIFALYLYNLTSEELPSTSSISSL